MNKILSDYFRNPTGYPENRSSEGFLLTSPTGAGKQSQLLQLSSKLKRLKNLEEFIEETVDYLTFSEEFENQTVEPPAFCTEELFKRYRYNYKINDLHFYDWNETDSCVTIFNEFANFIDGAIEIPSEDPTVDDYEYYSQFPGRVNRKHKQNNFNPNNYVASKLRLYKEELNSIESPLYTVWLPEYPREVQRVATSTFSSYIKYHSISFWNDLSNFVQKSIHKHKLQIKAIQKSLSIPRNRNLKVLIRSIIRIVKLTPDDGKDGDGAISLIQYLKKIISPILQLFYHGPSPTRIIVIY